MRIQNRLRATMNRHENLMFRCRRALSTGFRKATTIEEFGVLTAAILLVVFFSALAPDFLQIYSVASVFGSAVEFGVAGLGVTALMISGEFDLSVGAVFALVPMIMAWFFVKQNWSSWASFGVALLLAVLIGLVNGLSTVKLKIPSFIVTLGTALFWTSVSLNLTGGYGISFFGHDILMEALGGTSMGSTQISVSIWWLVSLALILMWIIHRTRFGNWMYAVGGDPVAARAMGVPVGLVKTVDFVVCSLLAGLAGIIEFGSLGSATPTQGGSLALDAIVVAVVGGASLMGGKGSIVGSVLGALVLGMAYTGLVLIGVSPTWFEGFVGFVLIFAVIVNLKSGGMGVKLGGGGLFRQ